MNIRPACPADLDDVFIMYRMAMEEVETLGGYPVQRGVEAWMSSYDALKGMIEEMDRNGDALVLIAEESVPVGFAIATVARLEAPYVPQIIGKSVYTYVLPQCRGGGTAKRLGLAKVEWCKSKGATTIEAYTTHGNRAKILMERNGYVPIGYELRRPI